jgi:hypothetical protein
MSRARRKSLVKSKKAYSRPDVEFLETRLAPALASTSSAVQFDPHLPPPGFTGNGVASIRLDAEVDLVVGQKQAAANFEAVANGVVLTGGGEAHLKLDKSGTLDLNGEKLEYALAVKADLFARQTGFDVEIAGEGGLEVDGSLAEAKTKIDGVAMLELDGVQGSSSVSSLQIEHVGDLQLEGSEQRAGLTITGDDSMKWMPGQNMVDAKAQNAVSAAVGGIPSAGGVLGPSANNKILIGLLIPPIATPGASQDIVHATPSSVDAACKFHLTDTEALVADKHSFDAGDRPGGGCLMLDGLTDVKVGQSEIASDKHLEAMGALTSFEQDNTAGLERGDIPGGFSQSHTHLHGSVLFEMDGGSTISLDNDQDVIQLKNVIEAKNIADLDLDEALDLRPGNQQALAGYKSHIAITPVIAESFSLKFTLFLEDGTPSRGESGPSAIDKILIGLLSPPIANTGQTGPISIDTDCKIRLAGDGGLIACKYGLDAGVGPGGGCLMLDGLTDLKLGQSEVASDKHLEAMGALSSFEQDSSTDLELGGVHRGSSQTHTHLHGSVLFEMDGGGTLSLDNNQDVAEYKEHVEAANVADLDHDGMCILGGANTQTPAEYTEDIIVTSLAGTAATLQLDEVVHFKAGDVTKTFLHQIREAAIQQIVEHFDDAL